MVVLLVFMSICFFEKHILRLKSVFHRLFYTFFIGFCLFVFFIFL
jgi:hypothetical protein